MSGYVGGVNPSGSTGAPPNITPAQLKVMQQFINNLWTYTYGSSEYGKGSPAPTPSQMSMIALSIAQFLAYVQIISPVTLDEGTQKLLNDLNLGDPSIAQEAQAYAAGPTDARLADFTNEYLQKAGDIAKDTHEWYTSNPGIPYVPNTTYLGDQALTSNEFAMLGRDAQDFLIVLNNYISAPSFDKLGKLSNIISDLQNDFRTSDPTNLDPYEMLIYSMINTPEGGASGKSLVAYVIENDSAGIADFLGEIDPTQGNAQFIANTLNVIINGNTGEFS